MILHCSSSISRSFLRKMSNSALPPSPIPIFTTVSAFRTWRQLAFDNKQSVGFIPTMGALHDGHLSLVRRSLADNDLTVISIFVNPAQFSPTEDLSTYPRTLPSDLSLLSELSITPSASQRAYGILGPREVSAIFLPNVHEMYPSGIELDVDKQRGTFVEVKGYGNVLEGASRPHFFRGVATVVLKLFNIIQPTNAYFGQKDIQQALILRRLTSDLILSHPKTQNLHIIETQREEDGLAMSSRNLRLNEQERKVAPALYAALVAAHDAWNASKSVDVCLEEAHKNITRFHSSLGASYAYISPKVDYISFNDGDTFLPLPASTTLKTTQGKEDIILSGAMWIGNVRIIDNIVIQNP